MARPLEVRRSNDVQGSFIGALIVLIAALSALGVLTVMKRQDRMEATPQLTQAEVDCAKTHCESTNRGDESLKHPPVKAIHHKNLKTTVAECVTTSFQHLFGAVLS